MISKLILQNLLHTNEYWKRVLTHLQPEYFDDPGENLVFRVISAYATKYNAPPTMDALAIEVDSTIGPDAQLAQAAESAMGDLDQISGEVQDTQWLVDRTEKFCQEQALHNALRRAILVLDGKDKELDKGSLPKLLDAALGITFDNRIGHDYFGDWAERWEEMHKDSVRIPFDLHYLNKITKGGIYQKTLTCLMAPSGVGKSIAMCHMAAGHLAMGLNVMYVSCEMSEFRLAERIDMNLMNMTDEEVAGLSKEQYKARLDKARSRMKAGRLLFKEYPTSEVGVAHVRNLLTEAKRKGFVPDVLYVDYLNIMKSTRIKDRSNTYTYVKDIAEELRGLAVELNLPIITATQVNRDGYDNSDISMTNTSESMGLVHTLDLFLALIQTDELAHQNQILVKQLKNRYRDEKRDGKFIVGMDKSKMKMYDVEPAAQKGLTQDTAAPPPVRNQTKRDFSDFS